MSGSAGQGVAWIGPHDAGSQPGAVQGKISAPPGLARLHLDPAQSAQHGILMPPNLPAVAGQVQTAMCGLPFRPLVLESASPGPQLLAPPVLRTNETTPIGAPKPGPDSWQEVKDPSGQSYWWNQQTNQTTAVGAPKPSSVASAGQAQPPAGGMAGGLGGALMDGMAWGVGTSVASRMMDSVLGPRQMEVVHTNEGGATGEGALRSNREQVNHLTSITHCHDSCLPHRRCRSPSVGVQVQRLRSLRRVVDSRSDCRITINASFCDSAHIVLGRAGWRFKSVGSLFDLVVHDG